MKKDLATKLSAHVGAPLMIHRPEYFALPAKGGDSCFGMSRGWWYSAERQGLIEFTRIRRPGCQLGRVLVSYARAAELIKRLGDRAAKKGRDAK